MIYTQLYAKYIDTGKGLSCVESWPGFLIQCDSESPQFKVLIFCVVGTKAVQVSVLKQSSLIASRGGGSAAHWVADPFFHGRITSAIRLFLNFWLKLQH